MRYDPISNSLFKENRSRFAKELKSNSLAIILSNDEFPKSGDSYFSFKQNSDLFYLTGIIQEESSLILFPDSSIKGNKEILFLKETNDHIAVWEGEKLSKKQASEISGIPENQIHWSSEFNSILHSMVHYAEPIYFNTNENDRYLHKIDYYDLRVIQKFKDQYPLHTLNRAAPIFRKLRSIKSVEEIKLLTKAADITHNAFMRILTYIKPGRWEFEIEAEITHEFMIARADGHAYSPIIASGGSACVLHYNTNNLVCGNGDLLLLDFGASYAMYNADLTRTVPVNGRFSPRQKEVYEAVLRILNASKKLLIPGTKLPDYRKETDQIAIEELHKLGLISKKEDKANSNTAKSWRKFYPHGISHYLGLDVHDLGDKNEIMKPGMVFTCEPGIYIREENIGIRLENDIVLTKEGNIDLMYKTPIHPEEIEELMNTET